MPILTKRPNKTPLGLYIHVPFCRSKCQYCDFYSLATKDDKLIDGYLDAVCDHIKEAGDLAPGYKVDSIYFGGGTPSFFGADGLAVILTTIRRNFDVDNNAEITFEANPDSVSDRLLHRLRAEGFNRVSLGFSPMTTRCSKNWAVPTPIPRRCPPITKSARPVSGMCPWI